MDPLSLTASIIAVLQVSGQISSYCFKYIRLCKDARHDPLRLFREIGGLYMILTTLKNMAERKETSENEPHSPPPYQGEDVSLFPTLQQLCQLHDVLEACHHRLEKLEKELSVPFHSTSKLRTRAGIIIHTLTWPLKEGELRKVLSEIHQFINIFTLALTIDETSVQYFLS